MTQPRALVATLVVGLAGVAGCQFPRDPSGTLDRVRGGDLRVGVVEREPFARFEGAEPAGERSS